MEGHFPTPLHEESRYENIRRARPLGVMILAVLHFLGGLALVGIQVVTIIKLPQASEGMREIGLPPALFFLSVSFLAVLCIASAIGMWIGTRWGWWLAAFYYVYSVFRNASALYLVIALADEIEPSPRGASYYIFKHMTRIVIHVLIFLYFMRENVLAFFHLEQLSKWKAVGALVGIGTAITIVATVAARVME